MTELDAFTATFGHGIARARDEATRRVLSEMLPRDRFSVVAADEVAFINDRIERPSGFNPLGRFRWVCDGVSVQGARVLL